jgi:hypothetical protein
MNATASAPMKLKLPKTLGATIDLLQTLRDQRTAIESKISQIKKQESAIEAHLMNNFARSELSGARGKLASVSLVEQDSVDVQDWDSFYEYIRKNKAWDMLRKRPSITACRARWDDNKVVPGIARKTFTQLKVIRAKE